jgi:hypothetical protein
LGALASLAGAISMDWSTDKEPVSYRPGEAMTIKMQLVDDGKPLAGKTLKWFRTGDDQKTTNGVATSSEAQPVEIKTSIDKPGFVHIEVSVLNPDGTPVKDAKDKPLKFEGGAGADPARLQSYRESADFDAFWKAQKARLAAVPMKASLTEFDSKNARFQIYDVKIDCAGGKPVSGYLSFPKDAKPKSLAAQVNFMGYGFNGANPECRDGAMMLSINVKGPKTIEYIQGSTHGYNPPHPKKQTVIVK